MSDNSPDALTDTHCHLNFDAFNGDLDAVLERAADAGVQRFIVPAIDLETCAAVQILADHHPGVYAAAGIHPNSTAAFTPVDIVELDALLSTGAFVAVGEIGLDYYWHDSPPDVQARALEAQLDLAARHQLPVIIHNRDASEDVMAILERWSNGLSGDLKNRPGVLHSFSGSRAIAERALAAGFYLGFTGPITFRNADETRSVAAMVPLDRLLIETDSPFLAPAPHRGKRNEPAYVRYVAERLALLKGISLAELAASTTANAERLFRLPVSQ